MEKEIVSRLPVDPIQKLREQLDQAVEAEQYEAAAELRDRLRGLTGEQE